MRTLFPCCLCCLQHAPLENLFEFPFLSRVFYLQPNNKRGSHDCFAVLVVVVQQHPLSPVFSLSFFMFIHFARASLLMRCTLMSKMCKQNNKYTLKAERHRAVLFWEINLCVCVCRHSSSHALQTRCERGAFMTMTDTHDFLI